MTFISVLAQNMKPGKTYRGNTECGEVLDGVAFTVLATVTFNAEAPLSVPVPYSEDYATLVQVQYDAWLFPFPETAVLAPNTWIEELES